MRCEGGQASVEWIGLVLLVSVALGGLTALVPQGRGLGAELVDRILPSLGDGGAATVAGTARPGSLSGPPTAARRLHRAPRWSHALRHAPLRHAPLRLARARRIAGAAAKHAWIVCLGYRRYRYEREHPARLAPLDRMPLRDAARIADDCLNPFAFLRERPRP